MSARTRIAGVLAALSLGAALSLTGTTPAGAAPTALAQPSAGTHYCCNKLGPLANLGGITQVLEGLGIKVYPTTLVGLGCTLMTSGGPPCRATPVMCTGPTVGGTRIVTFCMPAPAAVATSRACPKVRDPGPAARNIGVAGQQRTPSRWAWDTRSTVPA